MPVDQTSSDTTPARPIAKMAPLWAGGLGAIALGILFALLPSYLIYVPNWLPLLLIILTVMPLFVARLVGRSLPHFTARTLSFILLAIVTLVLVTAVDVLVFRLFSRTPTSGTFLLRDAGVLWFANILVFALWYWEIDGGGPRRRHSAGHVAIDLLFPQQATPLPHQHPWAPHFIDYVYLAFNTSTALSPTDTFPLTRRAKVLMMIQAATSMTIVIVIAARAVNIL